MTLKATLTLFMRFENQRLFLISLNPGFLNKYSMCITLLNATLMLAFEMQKFFFTLMRL